MKAKDLRYPFKWEERQPALSNGVLFVPKYYDKHTEWSFPQWEDPQIFGKNAPLFIEYCSGNGDWIVERAQSEPQHHWIAVEKRFDRVQKIWGRMRRAGIQNLLIVCGDALTFTRDYVPDLCFEESFINFPDPWPKGKHAKNRLLQEPFLTEMARCVKHQTTVVTDDPVYTESVCQALLKNPSWTPLIDSPYFKTEWEGYGDSYFDTLWREKGKQIHYIQFKKS